MTDTFGGRIRKQEKDTMRIRVWSELLMAVDISESRHLQKWGLQCADIQRNEWDIPARLGLPRHSG
jgi:hypothetical protein